MTNTNFNPVITIDSDLDSNFDFDSDVMEIDAGNPRRNRNGNGNGSGSIWQEQPSINLNTNNNNTRKFETPAAATTDPDILKAERAHDRELRHATLTILSERELLTVQAIAGGESISQTRRKFQARLLSPQDESVARGIRGEVFVVPDGDGDGDGSGGAVTVRRRGVVDVHEEGDGGWFPSGGKRKSAGGSSGGLTPERTRRSLGSSGSGSGRRVSSGR